MRLVFYIAVWISSSVLYVLAFANSQTACLEIALYDQSNVATQVFCMTQHKK